MWSETRTPIDNVLGQIVWPIYTILVGRYRAVLTKKSQVSTHSSQYPSGAYGALRVQKDRLG